MFSYKKEYEKMKAQNEELTQTITKLRVEVKELHWETESLKLENRRLSKISDNLFEAGCVIARSLEDLKKERQEGQEK